MAKLMKVENAAIVEVKQFGDTAIEKFIASRSISENSVKTYRNALRRLSDRSRCKCIRQQPARHRQECSDNSPLFDGCKGILRMDRQKKFLS